MRPFFCSYRTLTSISLGLMVSLWGCAGDADDEPEPPPYVAGDYVLALQQSDSDCLPPDFDFWEIFAFAENNGNNLPVITVAMSQVDAELAAVVSPADCSLTGSIVAGGAFSLSGSCDDEVMARDFTMTGTITAFGANWELQANLVIDVDLLVDGAPDDAVDCSVGAVSVSGTGSPEN